VCLALDELAALLRRRSLAFLTIATVASQMPSASASSGVRRSAAARAPE